MEWEQFDVLKLGNGSCACGHHFDDAGACASHHHRQPISSLAVSRCAAGTTHNLLFSRVCFVGLALERQVVWLDRSAHMGAHVVLAGCPEGARESGAMSTACGPVLLWMELWVAV